MALSKKDVKRMMPFVLEWITKDEASNIVRDLLERPTGIKNKSFRKTLKRINKELKRTKKQKSNATAKKAA